MRIVLVHDRGSLRRWHLWLADAIAENGRHEIAVAETATARPFPSAVGLLQALEKLIYRHERQCANDLCNTHKDSQGLIDRDVDLAGFDLVVDLSSGGFRCPPGLRVMAPLYNGIRDELAAIDALLSHQPVVLGFATAPLLILSVWGDPRLTRTRSSRHSTTSLVEPVRYYFGESSKSIRHCSTSLFTRLRLKK